MSANLARIRNWNRGQLAERISALEQQNAELVAALQMLADLHDASGMPQSAIRMNAAKALAKVKQP